MQLGRFKITHCGCSPYCPNWEIFKWGFIFAGWSFCWLPKEFINKQKLVKEFWERIQ